MSCLIASAPGSVMLTGEHAVLFEHRAIACAIDQYVTVTLVPQKDKTVFVQSTLGSFNTTLNALANESAHDNLRFVLTAIQRYNYHTGFHLDISSDINPTFGLGSSAAVTIATLSVCQRHANSETDIFMDALETIQLVQGRGSGTDIATSLTGGIIGYTMPHKDQCAAIKRLDANNLDAPHSTLPRLSLHYAGYKTKTADVLALVAEKTQDFPDLYAQLYQLMHAVSVKIEHAITLNDWQKVGKLMNVYQGLLDALSVNDATLSEIIYKLRARDDVLGAKISGSGLGDCVIALHKFSEKTNHQIGQTNEIQFQITNKGLRNA